MAKKKNSSSRELEELEQAFSAVAGTSKKQGKRRFLSVLLICLVAILLAGCASGAYLYFFSGVTPGVIMDNVSIAGIDVSGMNREEAAQALQQAAQAFDQDMVITVLDETVTVGADIAAVQLDVQAAAQAAYELGRTGTKVERKSQQMQAMAAGIVLDADDFIIINESGIRDALSELLSKYNTPVLQGSYQVTGEIPDLKADTEPDVQQQLEVIKGKPGYELDGNALITALIAAYADFEFTVDFPCQVTEPETLNMAAIHAEYKLEPVDSTMDMTTFEATEHTYGYEFDLTKAQELLAQTAEGESFTLDFARIAPKETQASLQALLFRDVLGSYTAYSSSDPANRDVNLRLSCQAINGTVLMPGEVFSYNPALGERTAEGGWKQADGYVGSETIKTYGGGICQASSCLYLSAMLADMEIVERTNHGFISAYMPYGMDATVSWGGPEFRFRNTSEYPLRIEAWSTGGAVTVRLVGTDTKDYYVKMTYEILSTNPFETVYKEFDADNEKGYKDGDTVISGYTGYRVRTYRCKYDKVTNELISKEVEVTSKYDRRDKVVCKIKEAETTDPTTEPSTDPTTDPTTTPSTEPPTETTEATTPSTEGAVTEG